MKQVYKIYSITTRDNFMLGFAECPPEGQLISWEDSKTLWKLVMVDVKNYKEYTSYYIKPSSHPFVYAGRLMSLDEDLCMRMVEGPSHNGLKDYCSGRDYLSSATISLCSAALAANFPLDKCDNPIVLCHAKLK